VSSQKTPQDLLRELEALKEDSFTLSQRHRRLLDAAREIIAGPKVTVEPTEALKTRQSES
jgi:hypothetical protein